MAQLGDESCYVKLLGEIGDVIAVYLTARFGPIELIEDCVQEGLVAIHAGRHTYDAKRPFRPWLFTIVRNCTIDMLRSQRSYKSLLQRSSEENISRSATLIEDEVGKSMMFAALKPTHREVLLLTKVTGLSISETADVLGISESAVRVRVHRGIKAARKIIQCGRI